jgi:TIR domain
MRAFMSYQTADKLIAARVSELLGKLGCTAFMAHEDILVSEEWRIRIIQELEVADLAVLILSKNYFGSIWCKQESGIAAFRKITIIPLSTDGTVPEGFIGHIQSTKIDPEAPKFIDLLPGLAKHDVKSLIDALIKIIAQSGSFRGAEANFQLLLPYIDKASREQVVTLLNESTANDQICHAGLCATTYLPPLFKSHGQFMEEGTRNELAGVLKQYEKVKR